MAWNRLRDSPLAGHPVNGLSLVQNLSHRSYTLWPMRLALVLQLCRELSLGQSLDRSQLQHRKLPDSEVEGHVLWENRESDDPSAEVVLLDETECFD